MMELINRYVHAVGKRLPRDKREDVERELRSLLLDTLEERGEEDENAQVALLTEFGPPDAMADRYRPRPQYIVGPKTYRLYWIIVGAIALAGFIAAIVTTGASALAGDGAWYALGVRGLNQWWTVFISGVGVVTLIMAAVERLVPEMSLDPTADEVWDPRMLPEVVEEQEFVTWEIIAEIVFMGVLIVLFGGFGQRLPIGGYYNDGWHTVPGLLADAFFTHYLPVMLVRWTLAIVLDVVLLRRGRWETGTRLVDLGLRGLDIAVMVWLMTGPAILNGDAARELLGNVPLDFDLVELGRTGFKVLLGLGILGTSIEIIKRAWRLFGLGKPVVVEE